MSWQVTPYTIPLVLATLVAAVATYAVWRERDSRAEFWGTLVQGTIVVWAGLHLAIVSSTQFGLKVFLLGLVVPITTCLAVTVFCFTLQYTGRGDLLTRRRMALLVGFPVGVLLLSLTNGYHELVFVNPRLDTGGSFVELTYGWGPAFVGIAGSGYAITVAYLGMLYRKFRYSRNVYRNISFVLFASILVLVCATVASTLQVSPFPHYSLLPMLYVFVGVVLVLATTSLRFVRLLPVERVLSVVNGGDGSLVPLARDVIMEEVDDGIVILDTGFRVVDINTTGKKMLATDRVVGRHVSDIVDPEILGEKDELYEIIWGTADPHELRDQVWVTTPGGDRCYDLTISELRGGNDALSGYVVLLHDITTQKRREERLRERERELERRTEALEREKAKLQHQNERLDQFASIISHDLRNPLNVAEGHVQLVRHELDDEDGSTEIDAETLETISEAHGRMEELVDDTLQLARQGKGITETEPVSLEATAIEAWENLETRDATLVDEIEAYVDGDRGRLLTLFENLFRNAVEHGRDDVTVEIDRRGEDGFYVADDGVGIPDDRRDEVVERGFSTNPGGTGLGLAIVRNVAGAHGWQLDVEESDDGGAQFVFSGVDLAERDDGVVSGPDGIEQSGTN